jgi:pyroglutamyl-peptidase
MLTVLITGFGRFPGAPFNPSGPLALRLARCRRPALAGMRRVAHVFATRYEAVDRELPALLARERPDIVLLFGVAPRARHIRIEELGRNRVSVLFPDAGGFRPTQPFIALRSVARRNRLPFARLVRAARLSGAKAVRSRNAGAYLCNYAYWKALERAGAGSRVVAFIHIPPIARSQLGRHTARLDDFVRAAEAILVALASWTRVEAALVKLRSRDCADHATEGAQYLTKSEVTGSRPNT